MKDKIFLIIGAIFIIIGLYKFDIFIYSTLDYFGKYVFVLALNLIPFYVAWLFHNKKPIFSLIWGIVAGATFYFMG